MDEPTRGDDSVSLDAVLELLASRWPRYLLYELQRDESLAPEEAVRRVAAREHGLDSTPHPDSDSSSHPDPDSTPDLDSDPDSTPDPDSGSILRPTSDQCEAVRTQLYHNTLPKLEAHDIIDWDGDEITTGEYAPLVAPYVEWAKKWEVDQ